MSIACILVCNSYKIFIPDLLISGLLSIKYEPHNTMKTINKLFNTFSLKVVFFFIIS